MESGSSTPSFAAEALDPCAAAAGTCARSSSAGADGCGGHLSAPWLPIALPACAAVLGDCTARVRGRGSPGNMILVHVACTGAHGAPQECIEAFLTINLLVRLLLAVTKQAYCLGVGSHECVLLPPAGFLPIGDLVKLA